MSIKKLKTVTFDMGDSRERELYRMLERRSDSFSDLVKALLFHRIYGDAPSAADDVADHGEAIRNSGLPFG
ncbi:hypothetical protein [Desmospora profundinema]|uniref:Antitoxin n=1 Tax=Desmospora profundinema TaxID=1571184 RepID=A0ABU1IJN6_9BACL|nr:hypothetical protein [Desmospora profundinema]MDR6224986.1 hypothetical protein [Desmospora profundinema]